MMSCVYQKKMFSLFLKSIDFSIVKASYVINAFTRTTSFWRICGFSNVTEHSNIVVILSKSMLMIFEKDDKFFSQSRFSSGAI